MRYDRLFASEGGVRGTRISGWWLGPPESALTYQLTIGRDERRDESGSLFLCTRTENAGRLVSCLDEQLLR